MSALFRNSIIVGSSADEILLSDAAPGEGKFDILFRNCIVQVKDILKPEQYPDFLTTQCENCITYTFGDTLFANQEGSDFHLDSLSIAEEHALVLPGIQVDLDERLRDPVNPDIGCYEYYPE